MISMVLQKDQLLFGRWCTLRKKRKGKESSETSDQIFGQDLCQAKLIHRRPIEGDDDSIVIKFFYV